MVAYVAPTRNVDVAEQEEFFSLVTSAGLEPRAQLRFHRRTPHPRWYFGSGQAEQIRQHCESHGTQLLVVNADLSPSQERNLETQLQCRVLSRTGLILDIFAQRARSHEGKLQVELAQLTYLSTRLVRGWSHLERQKGGIGLRGPGETQLELDRRLLTKRVQTLRRRLALVERQRAQSRMRRRRARLFRVALVGYTNAGKSTLFNSLTGSDVVVADQLFATLDPTHRRLHLGHGCDAVLSDTVGFVRDLPPELMQAFRSTLEEVCDSDLLVHVIDRSDPQHLEQAHQVREVLEQIGASELPVLEVHNKMDQVEEAAGLTGMNGSRRRLFVSAQTGAGLDELRAYLLKQLLSDTANVMLRLPVTGYPLRAELHRLGKVEMERFTEQGECEMRLRLPRSDVARFKQYQVTPLDPVAEREFGEQAR